MSPPATSTLACETQVAGTGVSGHSPYRTTQIISYPRVLPVRLGKSPLLPGNQSGV